VTAKVYPTMQYEASCGDKSILSIARVTTTSSSSKCISSLSRIFGTKVMSSGHKEVSSRVSGSLDRDASSVGFCIPLSSWVTCRKSPVTDGSAAIDYCCQLSISSLDEVEVKVSIISTDLLKLPGQCTGSASFGINGAEQRLDSEDLLGWLRVWVTWACHVPNSYLSRYRWPASHR
jgi:hypothetical protein